jgi:phosphomevalonate kinase
MAVNRYAICHLTPGGEAWGFSCTGFDAPDATLSRDRLLGPEAPTATDVASIPWHVLHALDTRELVSGGRVHTNTRGFFQGTEKLGLGSSAALTTAVYGAFCALLRQQPDYRTALHIHHNLQGKLGSGIDVAAAFFGGLLKFRRDETPTPAAPHHWPLPDHVHTTFVWTGHGAATPGHLRRFETWLRGPGSNEPIEALARISESLFATATLLDGLAEYRERLRALDAAARLGIYDASHNTLDRLAIDVGVVYKPCGAGGGDIGAAFSDDPQALHSFAEQATQQGFKPLALESASHGIEITR